MDEEVTFQVFRSKKRLRAEGTGELAVVGVFALMTTQLAGALEGPVTPLRKECIVELGFKLYHKK